MTLGRLLKENPCHMQTLASTELIKSSHVPMRSIKEKIETDEISKGGGDSIRNAC
jgi:hypothetical protein